jgi:hypothetical protein
LAGTIACPAFGEHKYGDRKKLVDGPLKRGTKRLHSSVNPAKEILGRQPLRLQFFGMYRWAAVG